jgi:hypothetical protein
MSGAGGIEIWSRGLKMKRIRPRHLWDREVVGRRCLRLGNNFARERDIVKAPVLHGTLCHGVDV